jgi:hypothetical protein
MITLTELNLPQEVITGFDRYGILLEGNKKEKKNEIITKIVSYFDSQKAGKIEINFTEVFQDNRIVLDDIKEIIKKTIYPFVMKYGSSSGLIIFRHCDTIFEKYNTNFNSFDVLSKIHAELSMLISEITNAHNNIKFVCESIVPCKDESLRESRLIPVTLE